MKTSTRYIIVENYDGKKKRWSWNVTDTYDGYIMDTFLHWMGAKVMVDRLNGEDGQERWGEG